MSRAARIRQKNRRKPLPDFTAITESQRRPKIAGVTPDRESIRDIDPDLGKAIRLWYPDANLNLTTPIPGEVSLAAINEIQRPISPLPKTKKMRHRVRRHSSIIPNASNIETFLARPFIEILGGTEVAVWFARELELEPMP